jgi:hypothetical protein
MKLRNIILAASIGLLGSQLANASPETDWPDFYADVAWSIPAGQEANTVPTKHAPSLMNTQYNPWCRQADCKTGWKNAREIIRDFTNETIAGSNDQRDAAEHIFYRVRDLVKLEDISFLTGYSAWKYRAGNTASKAALVVAMARSAKIPARFVIRDNATVVLKSTGYNSDDSASTTDNAAIDPAAFGNQHVYAELYIGDEWVAADPAWDSQLAGVLDIAKFGEALVSVNAKGGPNSGIVAADLPNDFVAGQKLQCSPGTNVNPATYVEAMDHMTAPPMQGCRYWRDVSSPLNQFTKNVRYRATIRDMGGVAAYGIAELQELRDIYNNGHGNGSDFQLMSNAMDQLKKAQKALGKGDTNGARANFAAAEAKIAQVSFLYNDDYDLDNQGLMEVRYSLALFSRQGATEAYVAFHEANPETINNRQRIDNIGLNWQATYGFDEEHWAFVTDPYTQISDYVPATTPHPAGITLGCNDTTPAPAGKAPWHCDSSLDGYILDNLLIQFYAFFQPMKISTIDEDNYTIAFNPRCTFVEVTYPGAPVPACMTTNNPAVLVDGEGIKYDPATTNWTLEAPVYSDRGAFFNKIPVYSIPGANGMPDFFEVTIDHYLRMISMMGMYEFQRERGRIDDLHVCNRVLDSGSNRACMGVFAMENNIAQDSIELIADLGVQQIAFDPGNLAKATFTDMGYAWEVENYIEDSSNPAMTLRILEAPGVDLVDGLVDAIESELANPVYAGKTVVVGMLSHGFPTSDVVEQAFGYPGCTDQWLPGSPYLCPFVSFNPNFADPNTFRDASLQWPTGYVYWEDQWHRNNFDMEDALAAEIEARIAAGGTTLELLDHNGDGAIGTRSEFPGAFGGAYGDGPTIVRDVTDGLIVIQNDFSEGDFDPSDRWIAGTELFGSGSLTASNTCASGRCQNVFGTQFGLPAYIREKTDAVGPVDYVIDMPWLWGVASSEDFHQKMTVFDAFRKGPANMIWVDSNLRSELKFLPSGVDQKPGLMASFGDRGFCKGDGDPVGTPGDGDDANLCWGPGYAPINFVHTAPVTEHQEFVRDSVVDGTLACFSDYANCGKLIQ